MAGGKVYTYAAGTSTPLATYTDYNGLSANTNPVILDAKGEANIWLGQQQYKIVLKTAADVTLWTVDNVGQNSLADLSAGFGQATDIASATTVDLGTITTHFANITGTTTITSFGSSAALTAPLYLVKFNGILTITNGANLATPTGANITTAVNDRAWVEYLGSGAWRIIEYVKANGTPIGVVAVANGGTGSAVAATGFDNIKQPATDSYSGVVEKATDAETQTGTDDTRYVSPANLKASSIGMGQTWQNVAASRALGTNYTNSTGRPIQVAVSASNGGTGSLGLSATVAGNTVSIATGGNTAGSAVSGSIIVPNGAVYQFNTSLGGSTILSWSELR